MQNNPSEPEARQPISARDAEAVVSQRIEDFGTGALPKVRVVEGPPGRWTVTWTSHRAICEPMPLAEWKRWLERHVGPLDPSRLQQTEG